MILDIKKYLFKVYVLFLKPKCTNLMNLCWVLGFTQS
jgi:hypothetical protein